MILLIIAVLFGLGFAYLATQNGAGVTLQAGSIFFADIPLYLVVLGSFLIGLFIAWILSAFGWISWTAKVHGKDKEIKEIEEQRDMLRDKLHELATENSRLEEENRNLREATPRQEAPENRKSFFERLHYSPLT